MTNRLDWGCAFDQHEGWLGSDVVDYGQSHGGDILEGLPWPDYHFDMIVANHSLTAIRFDDLPRALADLRRGPQSRGSAAPPRARYGSTA